MGHAADDQGAKPGIHSLANKIVASHTKADQALRLLAAQKHVDLPARTDIDDHDELAALHARKPGGEFDAQYVRNVIDDHDRMIEMYEAARNESVDPDIRRYADIMLPALRENREQALAMFNKQLGVSSR
jgi:putative membrane protein